VPRDRFRDELGFGPADVLVGAVGRLVPVKGHRVLIDAFERLAREEPGAGLVLAGDGPLREELKAAGRASDAGHRIRLVGERAVDANFYGSLDLFAYPSVAGAYGLVVLEAMACGLPVVASRLQGTDELIAEDGNGLLVHPADPSALATALLRLVRSAAERRRLGDQARHDAMKYSETAMVQHYEALYRSLLERPRLRGAGEGRQPVGPC
jgi:glycosyltransferase involved in cell wall biosynthesis